MKRLENDVACFSYDNSEAMQSSLQKLSGLVKKSPDVLQPIRSVNDRMKNLFSSAGFELYPTVMKTTLFYDAATGCFFKILHALNFKSRLMFLLTNKARAVYFLSEKLRAQGVRMQKVPAFGLLKDGRRPFFATQKAEGESLYDILIRGGKPLPMEMYRKVLDEVTRLHRLGFWFGDAHLSHIFIDGSSVSGFIDIDGIRRNHPCMLKNLAKDMAGLNHPGLPLGKVEKNSLINYYLDEMSITRKDRFLQMLNRYTERRWKE